MVPNIRRYAGGTGIGTYRRGKVLTDVGAVAPGQLIVHESMLFRATNLVKVTQTFQDKFFGIFVSPENPNEKSKAADEEFVVYPTDLEKGEYYIALEPAPSDVTPSSADADTEQPVPSAPAPAEPEAALDADLPTADEAVAEGEPEVPVKGASKSAAKAAKYVFYYKQGEPVEMNGKGLTSAKVDGEEESVQRALEGLSEDIGQEFPRVGYSLSLYVNYDGFAVDYSLDDIVAQVKEFEPDVTEAEVEKEIDAASEWVWQNVSLEAEPAEGTTAAVKQAYNEEGTDITPIAEEVMNITGKFEGSDGLKPSDYIRINNLKEALKEIAPRVTTEDLKSLEDYNYHLPVRLLKEIQKNASAKTAVSDRVAYFSKKFRTLTYFNSRNTSETVNCENQAQAKKLVDASGVEQQLKVTAIKSPVRENEDYGTQMQRLTRKLNQAAKAITSDWKVKVDLPRGSGTYNAPSEENARDYFAETSEEVKDAKSTSYGGNVYLYNGDELVEEFKPVTAAKTAGSEEPAVALEAPQKNPMTFGEPTHETPLGHFMDDKIQTTDADRVIDEVLTYLEAEHSTVFDVEYEEGNYVVVNRETETPIAQIWSNGGQVAVTALVGDGADTAAEKAADVVDLLLKLKDTKVEEAAEEPNAEDFSLEEVEEEQESEGTFGSRCSTISRLLANTETLASATGGEGDDGAAYDLIDGGGRNFTGVNEAVASTVVDEYLTGKACSFASLEDFAGFVQDMYGIAQTKTASVVAEAWHNEDRRAIVAFIAENATTDIN